MPPEMMAELQRSHTRRCGYNRIFPNLRVVQVASKEPHPKVRLQQHSIEPTIRKIPLQRSHTRRCGYNRPRWSKSGRNFRFKGATPEGAVTTYHSHLRTAFKGELRPASKEPHPKVRLQPNYFAPLLRGKLASKEPHPKVRLQPTTWMWEERLMAASKEPHPKVRLQPVDCPLPVSRSLLQRSHTRRCGYNAKAWEICESIIGFKGATPEGAVTTQLTCPLGRSIKLQRSHTRRCGYNRTTSRISKP